MGRIVPLEPHVWFRAIRNLRIQAASAVSTEQERLVRHAFHLCQLTPRPLGDFVRSDLEESELEDLLANGAWERAAAAIVGSPMSLHLEDLTDKTFEAEVRLPGQREPSSFRGSATAIAIVAAWAQCLIDLEGRAQSLSDKKAAQIPPKVLSELRPELS